MLNDHDVNSIKIELDILESLVIERKIAKAIRLISKIGRMLDGISYGREIPVMNRHSEITSGLSKPITYSKGIDRAITTDYFRQFKKGMREDNR